MTDFHIIIPARLNSSRLPNKVLLDLVGKPMIQRVYEAAKLSNAKTVTVATDSSAVLKACEKFGAPAVLTNSTHKSGTDRIAQCARILGFNSDDIIVNLQGDEPLIQPEFLDAVADKLKNSNEASVATLVSEINDPEDLNNPNVVKVVIDDNDLALYFSRAAIPHKFDNSVDLVYYRHIGIYAYVNSFLQELTSRPTCSYEDVEKLEQLRVLYMGKKIAVQVVNESVSANIDTKEDANKVIEIIKLAKKLKG